MIFSTFFSILAIMLVGVFYKKRSTFDSAFVLLSLLFFWGFYVLPASLLWLKDGIAYGGSVFYFRSSDWQRALIMGVVFLVGFFVPDFFGGKRRERLGKMVAVENSDEPNGRRLTIWFWIFLLVYVFYLFYLFLDSGRTARIYDSRAGVAEANRFAFFLFIVFNAVKFSAVFSALAVRKRGLALVILCFSMVVEFYGAPGRVALLVNVALLFLILLRFTAYRTIVLGYVVLSAGLPLILAMKSIVYSVAVNGVLPSISDIFAEGIDLDGLIGNFGHPFISLLNVDALLSEVGYRYFYDYPQGMLFFLRVIGLDFGDSITYYNTYGFLGIHASIIPPGYLAFGYVQLAVLGVFVAGFVFRLLGYFSGWVLSAVLKSDAEVAKFYFAFLAANTFYYGDFRIIVMNFFLPMFLVGFLYKFFLSKGCQY